MKTKIVVAVLLFGISLVPVANAGHKDIKHPQGQGFYDYARVIGVEPIVQHVAVSVPQRECWDEQVNYSRVYSRGGNVAGKMILGGIVGGVLGNHLSHGKDIATVAGTLIGASVGHDLASRGSRTVYEPVTAIEQRCQVSHVQHVEERIEGYWVTYRYKGEIFTTRMPYDPGDSIRVQVEVTPARGSRF